MQEIPFKNFQSEASVKRFKDTQEHMVDKIVSSEKPIVILVAPTGSGKSLIAAVSSYRKKGIIFYVCTDKFLQDQLVASFPEAVVLKGRNNYRCNLRTTGKKVVLADKCTGKCEGYKKGKTGCDYYDQKALLIAADFRIINTHYLLNELLYAGDLSNQDMIIMDEAHKIESAIVDFVSLEVTFKQNREYKLGIPDADATTEEWREWADESVLILTDIKKTFDSSLKKFERDLEEIIFKIEYSKHDTQAVALLYPEQKFFEKQIDEFEKESFVIQKLIAKTRLFVKLVKEDWLQTRDNFRVIFRPVWASDAGLTETFLFQHAKKWLLMSATLPDKDVFCESLGLDPNICDYINEPSVFDAKNRPIVFKPVMNMKYANRHDYHVMVREVLELVNLHPNEKGLIHTHSYAMAKLIMESGHPRLISHNTRNRKKVLDKFMASTEPLFLVSPSCTSGLSLDDDLGRINICVKMPYGNTKDDAVKARLACGERGQNWYRSVIIQIVQQLAGRVVRNSSDWGVTYILDNRFSRFIPRFPKWFQDAIIDYETFCKTSEFGPIKKEEQLIGSEW